MIAEGAASARKSVCPRADCETKRTEFMSVTLKEVQTKKDLKSFVEFFWGPLKQSLKYEESWDGDNKVQFKVTHCTVCEACKKAGLTDIGYHVYCMTDPAVIKGINPEIQFERTHTLMQGDDYCDHCYMCK